MAPVKDNKSPLAARKRASLLNNWKSARLLANWDRYYHLLRQQPEVAYDKEGSLAVRTKLRRKFRTLTDPSLRTKEELLESIKH